MMMRNLFTTLRGSPRQRRHPWAVGRRVSPHLSPRPKGEGTRKPAPEETGHARRFERRQTIPPLPRGEGWGEGRGNVASTLVSSLIVLIGLSLSGQGLTSAAEETNAPAAAPSQAPATNSPPGAAASPSLDFQSFKIIAERNIFNPNRRPGLSSQRPPPRAVRTEAFSLVGTLLDEGGTGTFAFFDGSGSQYKKVLKIGEAIAGYKVCEIASDAVRLEAEDTKIDLPMGMQMKRQEEEKWQLVLGAAASAPSGPSSSPSTSASSNSSFGNRDRGSDFGRRDRGSDPGRRDRGTDFGRRDRSAESTPRERISTSAGSIDAGLEARTDVVADVGTEAGAVPETEVKPDGGSSSGGAADDILKKLMQRREQESNK